MNLLWDQEPVVAANDFSPFTGEVALPAGIGDASAQARAPFTPAAGTRPRRRSLLEIGLAHGDGADALEAKACKADADRRRADRAAGAEQHGAGTESIGEATGEARAMESDPAAATPGVAAIAALADDIRATQATTARLAGELAELEAKEAELRRELMAMLMRAAAPHDQRSGDQRPGDQRPGDQRPDGQRPDGKRPAQRRHALPTAVP